MRHAHFRINHLIIGAFILIFGLISLLDNMGILRTNVFEVFWPLVLCALGVARMTRPGNGDQRTFGMILIGLGAFLVLHNLGYIAAGMHVFWPVVLILVGLRIMSRSSRRGSDELAFQSYNRHGDTNEFIDLSAFMGGGKVGNDSNNFKGGNLSAIMGGIDVDLRHAVMQEPKAVIKVFAFWGGIVIRVPQDWSVVVNGMPIMGGIEDKTVPALGDAKQLIIEGEVIMGGVEIKN
ncbi:cell wall-active antibiotics response protein [Burkholderiaceae bacterium DAT-1]|nr:cell wall-active antibiotics response protein [Burkholderiaceae bacterium DAT-1]